MKKKSNLDFESRKNLERYAELVWNIYDQMSEEQKHELFLRLQWEKRNKGTSQNK